MPRLDGDAVEDSLRLGAEHLSHATQVFAVGADDERVRLDVAPRHRIIRTRQVELGGLWLSGTTGVVGAVAGRKRLLVGGNAALHARIVDGSRLAVEVIHGNRPRTSGASGDSRQSKRRSRCQVPRISSRKIVHSNPDRVTTL